MRIVIKSLILVSLGLVTLNSCFISKNKTKNCPIGVRISLNFDTVKYVNKPDLTNMIFKEKIFITMTNNTSNILNFFENPNLGYNSEPAIDFQYVIYKEKSGSFTKFDINREDNSFLVIERAEFPVDYIYIQPKKSRTWSYPFIRDLPSGNYRVGILVDSIHNGFREDCQKSNFISFSVLE